MKRKDWNQTIPVHDYRSALQGALTWLGDRYLLAEPTPRLQERSPFFTEKRTWHPVVVAGALAKTSR
jgi:hypothetical protein